MKASAESNPFTALVFEQLRVTTLFVLECGFRCALARNRYRCQSCSRNSESNWLTLDEKSVLMEEARNDKQRIRAWRRTINTPFPGLREVARSTAGAAQKRASGARDLLHEFDTAYTLEARNNVMPEGITEYYKLNGDEIFSKFSK